MKTLACLPRWRRQGGSDNRKAVSVPRRGDSGVRATDRSVGARNGCKFGTGRAICIYGVPRVPAVPGGIVAPEE